MATMTMPNFLVIGAAKSATSALCDYLDQHPQVFVSPSREPNFFIAEGRPRIPYRGPGDREVIQRLDMWVWTRDAYEALFAGVTTETAYGEGSTWYLYHEDAPQRIRRHLPHAKLIAILRNPVDRAYSAFTMQRRDGREPETDFVRALALEDARVKAGWEPMWHYRRMGFYHQQLRRYFSIFASDQIRVVLQDDLMERPAEVLHDLFRFLEVDAAFQPDFSRRHNVSLVPAHPIYHNLVVGPSHLKAVVKSVVPSRPRRRIKRWLPDSRLTRPDAIPPAARALLMDAYRDDILALQDLLQRDLGRWLG